MSKFFDYYNVSLYEEFAGIPWLVKRKSHATRKEAYESVIQEVKNSGFKVIEKEIINSLEGKDEYNLTNDITIAVEGELNEQQN
jgi:phage terminase large subunit-like protein